MNWLRRIAKALLLIVAGLVVALMLGFAVLWTYSPGKPQPLTDASGIEIAGSISTIEAMTLGGVEQHMIIRGEDRTKPVMLFLHGGPGSPEFPMLRQTNLGLEADFVMVYWEQRGAGMSFSSDIPRESMTLDQFVADTRELTEALAARFGQEKIFLMGHSWGTLVGMLTVHKHPELFHAFFGIGLAADQFRGEQVSLQWTKDQAEAAGDAEAIEALAQLTFPARENGGDQWLDYIRTERGYLGRFGGSVSLNPTTMTTIVRWMLETPEYTVSDKLNYVRGALFSLETLWPDVMNTNLFEVVNRVEIPIYILQGAYDFQTPYPIAKEFFDGLDAPVKEFITFENSAHSPNMEEPAKFNAVVRARTGLE